MPDFLLPDLGEGLTEADILSWSVDVGDTVTVDQVVVEVETAKAAVEVPIPFAGVVSALHARPGDTVAVGSPLISVTAVDDTPAESSGNVLIGYGTAASSARRQRRRSGRSVRQPLNGSLRGSLQGAASSATEVKPAPVLTAVSMTADVDETAQRRSAYAPAVISPLVRKAARDAGVDVAAVRGRGPGGLVLRSDVERAVADVSPSAQPVTYRGAAVDAPPSDGEPQRIPLIGVRKAMADKLSRSRREIPEATVWVDVDATPLMIARAQLNVRDPQRPVSVLAMIARFTTAGLRRYPELNSRVEGNEIVVYPSIHLGFAAQTDRGLVVPVVPDAQRLSLRALSAAISARTESARSGTLTPREMTGGTFTVNNYGIFGVDGSAAIINHPEAAILGIGRIVDKPWVIDSELAVRKVSQLTLAFDHRVCDGATAGGFLRFVADCVESPIVALGEL